MKTVLAIDEGTTGSTALVMSHDGEILGRGYREFTQHFPEPGRVEHDASEIWHVTLDAAREAVGQSGSAPDALGITNQRETIVVWDRKTGEPLHRAIVWQDRRTAARCRALAQEVSAAELYERTGLVWDPYFSGTKVEWLLDNVDGLRDRVDSGGAVFGTIDTWLAYKLSGGRTFVTDHSNAARTMLYNIGEHGWDERLLGLFRVPRSALARVCGSSEVVGQTDPDLFGGAVPIAGIAGDQQSALYGQACWEAGEAKCTYGTGAFLLMNLGADRTVQGGGGGMLTTIGCDARGLPAYVLEGSIFIAGAAMQWLRDGLQILDRAADSEAMARGLEDSGGVYFVPALVGLGAPHWEADARGTIVGITRGTTREHLARAALEAMAYGTRELTEAMTAASGVVLTRIKVDGGAAANDWLIGFLADTLNVPAARPDIVETTALGAAGLAGLATGVWNSPEEFAASRTYRDFEPTGKGSIGFEGWKTAVETAVYWARKQL